MSEKASLKTEPIPWRLWIKSPAYLKLTPEKKIKSLLTIIERKEKHSVDVDVLRQKLQVKRNDFEKRWKETPYPHTCLDALILSAGIGLIDEFLVGLEQKEAKK